MKKGVVFLRGGWYPNTHYEDTLSRSSNLCSRKYICELPSGVVDSSDTKKILKSLRLKNVSRLICAHLNINSVSNKFDSLVNIKNNNINILMISEKSWTHCSQLGSFSFMGFKSYIDFTEIVKKVEFCYISVKTFYQNLWTQKWQWMVFFVEVNLRKKVNYRLLL